ncbi:hypothetical protein PMY12_14865 [Clostridium tertium]|uniref:phage tail protein n=2 Tax=Bacteria TaxID=2 RepID=UPI00232F3884|nr:phage tail protein [Clostridium tertium]MDB1931668.1 hypothetical protein [Clostridium tertium]MDB1938286.1 hypothetical protein [Clostridium tertium]MDI9216037.1 hypothetical protein [Clostridium tertium]
MKEIDRIRLFKSETSKADLLANKQDRLIAVLDSYVLDGKCNFKIDSNHVSTITLDGDLLGDLVNEIDERAIIEIHVLNQDHYFVVFNPKKDLDEIELSCKYWGTATLESMYIVDSKPRNLDGLAMMDWLKTNTEEYKQGNQYARDLEVASNLSDLKSTNIWHNNFYDTVSDLQDLYGCEIKKEGFKVELVDYVGSKTAKYKVEYGKNLISNSSEEDLSIIKGVLAKGYDKIYADNIIYSGKLADNPNLLGQTVEKVYPVRVREEGKEDEDGYTYYNTESEAKAELERLARLEFTVNKVDEPKVTFDTEFLELSTVEEHKDDAKVWLSIGDKIATYIPKFNIDIETRIIEMEVDVLADEITSITLSNNDIKDLKPPTLNSIKKEIQKLPTIEEVLITAKNESLNTVMNGFGGYAHYNPNYTAWTDSKDIKKARQGLLANKNGWFFFRNGLNIQTGEANDVTMIADINGNFSASVINTGILNANLIKTGVLSSFNGKSQISMENGTFNFGNKLIYDGDTVSLDGTFETHNSNGSNAIKIEKVKMHFYEWNTSGRSVGTIYSGEDTSNSAIKSMNMSNSMTAYLMLGYEISNGTKNSYIVFDKYNKVGKYNVPINITEKSEFFADAYFPNQVIFGSTKNSNNPSIFRGSNGNVLVLDIDTSNEDNGFQVQNKSGGVPVSIKGGRNYPINLNQNTQVLGSFSVSGSKNSIQATKSYGERLINAYETAEYYFADIGSGVVNADGECIIWIDEILKECINTNCEYHVFTQIYNGSITSIKRFEDYFIVYGKAGTNFGWELKAKRKGYENVRLDSPEIGIVEDIPIFTEEDLKPETSEDILIQELEFNLEEVLMEVV